MLSIGSGTTSPGNWQARTYDEPAGRLYAGEGPQEPGCLQRFPFGCFAELRDFIGYLGVIPCPGPGLASTQNRVHETQYLNRRHRYADARRAPSSATRPSRAPSSTVRPSSSR